MVFSCSKVSEFRRLVNNLLELFLHSLHSITAITEETGRNFLELELLCKILSVSCHRVDCL
jgi:hypothetical protein